jgi:hypothetical protein
VPQKERGLQALRHTALGFRHAFGLFPQAVKPCPAKALTATPETIVAESRPTKGPRTKISKLKNAAKTAVF